MNLKGQGKSEAHNCTSWKITATSDFSATPKSKLQIASKLIGLMTVAEEWGNLDWYGGWRAGNAVVQEEGIWRGRASVRRSAGRPEWP